MTPGSGVRGEAGWGWGGGRGVSSGNDAGRHMSLFPLPLTSLILILFQGACRRRKHKGRERNQEVVSEGKGKYAKRFGNYQIEGASMGKTRELEGERGRGLGFC